MSIAPTLLLLLLLLPRRRLDVPLEVGPEEGPIGEDVGDVPAPSDHGPGKMEHLLLVHVERVVIQLVRQQVLVVVVVVIVALVLVVGKVPSVERIANATAARSIAVEPPSREVPRPTRHQRPFRHRHRRGDGASLRRSRGEVDSVASGVGRAVVGAVVVVRGGAAASGHGDGHFAEVSCGTMSLE